ncbi:hypothetical protein [Nocardioides pacificus]
MRLAHPFQPGDDSASGAPDPHGPAEGESRSFDPEQVPMYPMVRAVIRQTEDGDLQGEVDDVVLARDTELEPVRRAVIDAAAAKAARRMGPLKAIRVRVTGTDGAVFNVVVDAAGGVHELNSAGTVSGSRGGSAAKPTGAKGGVSCLMVLVLAVSVLLIAAPLTVFVLSRMGGSEETARPTSPDPTQLPVLAPAPYSAVAAWSVDLGTETFASATAQVVADPERVYAVREGGTEVSAYTGSNGLHEWTNDALDGSVLAGPSLVSLDEEEALVVASTQELLALDPETGTEEGEWPLSGTQGVVMTSSGPLVKVDETHVQVVSEGQLVTRVIPATGTPVAPLPDGSVLVVGGRGEVWKSASESLAGDPQLLDPVDGAEFDSIAGWTGSQLVLAYKATDHAGTDTVRLAAYDAASLERQWISGWVPAVQATTQTDGLALQSAPAGEWGIYGSTALDLATGTDAELPQDWQSTAVGDDIAFGTGEGRPLVATAEGATAESLGAPQPAPSTTLTAPQAVAGSVGYLVASGGTNKTVLFAVETEKNGGQR